MTFSYASFILQRVVLPIVLVLGALGRPVGISFVYLLMFFVAPFLPLVTKQNFRTSTAAYLIILLTLSILLLIGHSALQLAVYFMKSSLAFSNCSFSEQLLRHIGFISFKDLSATHIIQWCSPDIIVLITSLITYFTMKSTVVEPQLENGEGEILRATLSEFDNLSAAAEAEGNATNASIDTKPKTNGIRNLNEQHSNFDGIIMILRNLSHINVAPVFCLAVLFFAAVLRPSIPGGFYFLVFLISGTYWASYRKLQRKFSIFLRLVMLVIVIHTILIVSYQTPWMQQRLDENLLISRLIGLEPLITSNCANDIRIIIFQNKYKLDSFFNPIILCLAYYVLALTSKNLSKPRIIAKTTNRTTTTTTTTTYNVEVDNNSINSGNSKIQRSLSLLTHSTRVSRKDMSWNKTPCLNVRLQRVQQRPSIRNTLTEVMPLMRSNQTENGIEMNSIAGGANASLPIDTGRPNDDDYKSGVCDQIIYGITSVGGFIYQNSYIFTNVLMMAWSIVYHSWLTFVFLLWANALWMIPNQRKSMMRFSPFIVIYAEILLLAQYIYGMNLRNDELPSRTQYGDVNLAQVGFERPQEHGIQPCVPLIVKTLFLLMFWVTLRQFFKEKATRHTVRTFGDVFAPLQLQVSTMTPGGSHEGIRKVSSKFLKRFGIIIKNLLVRLWIWLLVLVIFLCAMTGKNMTGFRICYMALFLFFLLVFQSSAIAWVRVMYGFWLFLIFYAMFILILIYTYQFDKFDKYWQEYFSLSPQLQSDIGLERFRTKDLFLHLLPPTMIVILTVLQVHYFHKRFVHALQKPAFIKRNEPISKRRARSMSRPLEGENADFTQSMGELIYLFLKRCRQKIVRYFKWFKHIMWRILELHWIKFVYIMAFVCSVSEQSILHIPLVVLSLVGILTKTPMKIFFSRILSLFIAIIVLAKMIYQITYLKHSDYDVICRRDNETNNNAEWFGLSKANKESGLMGLLKCYIYYMVVVTLHAVITMRQYQMRRLRGTENQPIPKVAFPAVTRKDAEVDLGGLVKYMINYGFYKFGLEISLVCLVITITYRRDVVALIYTIWLIFLLLMRRHRIQRIWSTFIIFITVSIFLQYILLVGFPPTLCIDYPWSSSDYSESVQKWGMLPGFLSYDHSRKLIFDYILLLLIIRQKTVFRVEVDPHHPGGSNKSVINDINNLGKVDFENPTHDFLSQIRNYLDIVKHAILCGFYWVTLAVVFIAGTNIVDILAIGYLIGAFTFLWEGSDFYLRPIKSILRRWRLFIAYNVLNILIKTCLQMIGCLFMETLTAKCCWLVHLLGIHCASGAYMLAPDTDFVEGSFDCPLIALKGVLLWDAVCFAFLILQLRIFKSHYFCHIINDTRANGILASRGAEIIERLRQKQLERRLEHDEQVLQKIKRKMEKIRLGQQKMLKRSDKPTHFDEYGGPIYSSKPYKRKEIKTHPNAVRAGDYYMFEDLDEKFEFDLIPETGVLFQTDTDHDNITESELKMNRRKTLYYEGQKARTTKDSLTSVAEPSTSQGHQPAKPLSPPEAKAKLPEADSSDITEKESDDDLNANPIVRLLEGFLVALTIRLNRFSRNYRYVNKILEEEKKTLKESNNLYKMKFPITAAGSSFLFNASNRKSARGESLPSSIQTSDKQTQVTPLSFEKSSDSDLDGSSIQSARSKGSKSEPMPEKSLKPSLANNQRHQRSSISISKQLSINSDESTDFGLEEEDFTARDHNIVVEVLISAWYAILSNTDLICYIVVFIHQVVNASLISLPLPLMVFLWGTLSVPRPTKTFWVTLIAYTQAIVLIKCVFQFKLIWNNYYYNLSSNPLGVEQLFGLDTSPNHTIYDLLLLLVLFFHRFILKSHGLWKLNDSRSFLLKNRRLSINKSFSQDIAFLDSEYATHDEIGNRESDAKRNRYYSGLKKFFDNLIHKSRLTTDVYALMFLCDFINFFVLLFGFNAFSSKHNDATDGGVKTYLAENKVPIPFLIMLLVQFILIIIDRALYLRRALLNKIIFHFISVIGVHVWMFFIVPAVTEASFSSSAPPVIFYIIKCFYLLLSSYQIRCGYPKRILGNFLTKGFSIVNMIAFKIYMLIPFLYELRTILDWLCTDTTMTLFDWLKMEDIFAHIYFIKCLREMESDFPAPRAEKKATFTKLLMGGSAIVLIAFLIWGPLTLFALFNAVGQSNVPTEVSISLRIGSYDPIYSTTTRDSTIVFDDDMFERMKLAYIKEKTALSILTSYLPSDIAAVKLSGNSPSMWNIAPPDKNKLINDLKGNNTLTVRLSYYLTRTPPSKGQSGIVEAEVIYKINDTYKYRQDMIEMLQGNTSVNSIIIPYIIPKFIKVVNSGQPSYISQFSHGDNLRGLVLRINNVGSNQWWEINDYCDESEITDLLRKLPLFDCNTGVVFYTFNDKKFPSTLTFLTAGGIIGLYTTFVLLASRFLKAFLGGYTHRIMYEDVPYVDRVLQLCLDIYLVREALEFVLEEDLFAKLIFLYRSPETMIKWTRPREDGVEDETDTESVRSRGSARRILDHSQ